MTHKLARVRSQTPHASPCSLELKGFGRLGAKSTKAYVLTTPRVHSSQGVVCLNHGTCLDCRPYPFQFTTIEAVHEQNCEYVWLVLLNHFYSANVNPISISLFTVTPVNNKQVLNWSVVQMTRNWLTQFTVAIAFGWDHIMLEQGCSTHTHRFIHSARITYAMAHRIVSLPCRTTSMLVSPSQSKDAWQGQGL